MKCFSLVTHKVSPWKFKISFSTKYSKLNWNLGLQWNFQDLIMKNTKIIWEIVMLGVSFSFWFYDCDERVSGFSFLIWVCHRGVWFRLKFCFVISVFRFKFNLGPFERVFGFSFKILGSFIGVFGLVWCVRVVMKLTNDHNDIYCIFLQ